VSAPGGSEAVRIAGVVWSSVRSAIFRAAAALERLAGDWLGAIVLFVVALAVYAFQALAWPLKSGGDLDEYLLGYIQILDRHPVVPWAMEFRTPIAGLVTGLGLDVGHGALAEPLAAVLYAASIVCWAAVGLYFGRRVALVTAVALLIFPGYALLFHEYGVWMVFGAAFAGWALLVCRAVRQPSTARLVLAGLGIAVMALIRPGNAAIVLVALFPLATLGTSRQRLARVAIVAAAALLPMAAWTAQNGWRFGDYTLARGGSAIIPFYRSFLVDQIVSPENGASSRRLQQAIAQDLVTREPYRSYGVTTREIFAQPSYRVHEDLMSLSDQVWGWKSSYSTLRSTAFEAIERHPGTYATGVVHTIVYELRHPFYRLDSVPSQASGQGSDKATITVNGKRLPAPGNGQPVAGGQNVWISRPDQAIRQTWTSPTQYHFTFTDPTLARPFQHVQHRLTTLFERLPSRQANTGLAHRLDQLSHVYPPPILWLILGALVLAIRRPRDSLALIVIGLGALIAIAFTALGSAGDLHYALPVTPAFIMLGAAAVLAPRSERVKSTADERSPGAVGRAYPRAAPALKRRLRIVIPAVTVALALFVFFAFVPELLGDWPYNAFGKNSRTHASRPHARALEGLTGQATVAG
jgi:hypothetical protein